MTGAGPFVVVGAGIAGLATALALARRGRRVVAIERADRLEEVGAGLQLSPNASRILVDLGLGPALERRWVEPEALVIRNGESGADLARLPLGPAMRAAYGAPYAVVHRGDLQAALLDAVRAEPSVALHLGARLSAAVETGTAVAVDALLPSGPLRFDAPALIGADGVRSQVRTAVLGGPPPVYSGRMAWRATFPAEAWSGDREVLRATGLWLGRDAHLVHYPLRGGREINVVIVVSGPMADERWDSPGDPAEIRRRLAGWAAPARALAATPDDWRRWALCAVPEDAPWRRGRIALVGDAAHAMLPFAAQGGAMAIEDAAVLADLLAESADVPDRLAEYERRRRPRVGRVVGTARRNGTVYHLAGLPARARDLAIRALGPERMAARMDWIWGWRPG